MPRTNQGKTSSQGSRSSKSENIRPSKTNQINTNDSIDGVKKPRRKSSMVKFREDTIKYSRMVGPLTANKTMRRVFKKHVQNYLEKYPIVEYDMGTYEIKPSEDFIFNVQVSRDALKIIKSTHWSYLERMLAEANRITTSRGEKKTTSNDLSSAIANLPQNFKYEHKSLSF